MVRVLCLCVCVCVCKHADTWYHIAVAADGWNNDGDEVYDGDGSCLLFRISRWHRARLSANTHTTHTYAHPHANKLLLYVFHTVSFMMKTWKQLEHSQSIGSTWWLLHSGMGSWRTCMFFFLYHVHAHLPDDRMRRTQWRTLPKYPSDTTRTTDCWYSYIPWLDLNW